VANNNYPQITSITSEALQQQIRILLPSQEGFGTDLMAQNVIVPIIDLTAAAEGSSIPDYLRNALSFSSNTSFQARNSTVTIANTAGFWRIIGNVSLSTNAATKTGKISMSDGVSTKDLLTWIGEANSGSMSWSFDFNIFLESGDSITATSNDTGMVVHGSSRQIADVGGILINPIGFNPQ
jgi:hypothetical protein